VFNHRCAWQYGVCAGYSAYWHRADV